MNFMSIIITLIPVVLMLKAVTLEGEFEEVIKAANLNRKEQINRQNFSTNITSKKLLLKTLKDYGVYSHELDNEDIVCYIEETSLTFRQKIEGDYIVEVSGINDIRKTYEQLKIIDEEYKHNVQGYTYEKVKQKIAASKLQIEQEEVLEDNSIVITVNF